MSKYYLSFFFCIVFMSLLRQVQGQEIVAYQPLFEDTTSTGPSKELTQKAFQLRAEFPQQLQGQFKVFSVSYQGMKQHIPSEGEIRTISQSLKDTFPYGVPFYLTFEWLRSTSQNFVRTYLDVYVKLPDTGPFQCLSELERFAIVGGFHDYGRSLVPRDQDFTNLEEVELQVMDSLQMLTKKLTSCCDSNQRNRCEPCLSDKQIYAAFNEFNNRVSHAQVHKETQGKIKKREKAQESNGSNYHISEIEPIYVKWDGTEIRLSSLLSKYFATRAKGIYWETIVVPPQLCKAVQKEKLLDFIHKKEDTIREETKGKKIPEAIHKLMAQIRDDGNLLLKVSTDHWMYHPINLKPIKPVLIGK